MCKKVLFKLVNKLNKHDWIKEIPEIPDLEEQVEATEDMAFKVAEAPE